MSEETQTERQERHRAHQEKMDWQKQLKAIRKERHYAHWNRRKVIPIQLV